MQELDFFKQLLGLEDPWQVDSVEIDRPSNRLDIHIGYAGGRKKGLFGGNEKPHCPECSAELPSGDDYESVSLRHLPMAGLRTYLHVPPADAVDCDRADCVCIKPWAAAGVRMTQVMQEHVLAAMQSAHSNQAAAKLAGISSSEIREISEITGIGVSAQDDQVQNEARLQEDTASHDFELVDSGRVPPADHAGWQRLINGELPIRTDSVALRMLLQRVRNDIEKNPTEQSRLAGGKVLRQFFIKNQQLLHEEIELLRADQGLADRAGEESHGGNLPPESAPVWQQLIDGDLRLDTRVVGLQMMIERVRQSIERNPTQANRLAGARILRQFFSKHQNRLEAEIRQLGGQAPAGDTATPTAPAPATDDGNVEAALPGERDPVWQQLISGDINIESEVISLKMLLERVRQAVSRNPGPSNRVAAAKILRQYFVKNRHRHDAEIRQLQAGADAAAAQAAPVTLPTEDHPNWQRLINGDIALQTDAVSLKMLLERIRQAIARKPSETNRLAGARMLHQYFSKNQHRHAEEIRLLAGEQAPAEPAATVDEHSGQVPAINHPSWQRLINGELQIMTEAVGLKMMLERIRLSIEHNPSEASRLAGAKILRQYFIKHQHKHRAELDQLRAA